MFGWQRLNENQTNKVWFHTNYFVTYSVNTIHHISSRSIWLAASQFNDVRICLIAFGCVCVCLMHRVVHCTWYMICKWKKLQKNLFCIRSNGVFAWLVLHCYKLSVAYLIIIDTHVPMFKPVRAFMQCQCQCQCMASMHFVKRLSMHKQWIWLIVMCVCNVQCSVWCLHECVLC